MSYHLTQSDLQQLKCVEFEKLIYDFGEIIGCHMGGDDKSEARARSMMRDFLNEVSRELDPENHVHLYDE